MVRAKLDALQIELICTPAIQNSGHWFAAPSACVAFRIPAQGTSVEFRAPVEQLL
jgi:hypothetical protein